MANIPHNETPHHDYQPDPIARWATLAFFATFPGARNAILYLFLFSAFALIVCIVGVFNLSWDGPTWTQAHPTGAILIIFFGFLLPFIAGAAFVGIWIPSTIMAWAAPRMVRKWATVLDDEEDE